MGQARREVWHKTCYNCSKKNEVQTRDGLETLKYEREGDI